MTELEKAAGEELIHSYVNPNIGNFEYGRGAMLNMFRKGAEWQSKQSPWISVEDRLPEKDGLRVWVKSNCLNEQPLVYWKGKFYARLSDGCYDGSVTHWMPIPE